MIFLYEFELGHNAAEITHNINEAFDGCTANKRTGRHWFKKFCSRNMSFENEGPGRPEIVLWRRKLYWGQRFDFFKLKQTRVK